MSTQTELEPTPVLTAVAGMPQDLVDKGWGLYLTDTMRFRASNNARCLNAGPSPTAQEVIEEARNLDTEFAEAEAIREEAAAIAYDEGIAEANRLIEEAKTSEGAARAAAAHNAIIDAERPEPAREKRPTVTTLLAVSTVRTDGGTQMREALNMLTVSEYSAAMKDGAKFPAVDVFHDMSSGDYWLAGGFHRHSATIDAGLKEILANVHDGSLRDALIFATGENTIHGLQRTNAEKHRAVETLLRDREWVTKADSVIARQAGVSQPFVSDIRAGLELKTVISPQALREGADGVVRDVTRIGDRAEAKPADERQTTLADIEGVDLPPRLEDEEQEAGAGGRPSEEDAGGEVESVPPAVAGGSALARAVGVTDEIVQALERHAGVLYRGQLEDMGFKYGDILGAVTAGVIAQPETGKFTLPDHKPQPSAGSRDITVGTKAAQSKASGVPDPEGWAGMAVKLNVAIKPGKALNRAIVVSGQVGEMSPIFRTGHTLSDLDPLPNVLLQMLDNLKRVFAEKGKAAPAARKPPPRKPPARKAAPKKGPAAKKKPSKKVARKK